MNVCLNPPPCLWHVEAWKNAKSCPDQTARAQAHVRAPAHSAATLRRNAAQPGPSTKCCAAARKARTAPWPSALVTSPTIAPGTRAAVPLPELSAWCAIDNAIVMAQPRPTISPPKPNMNVKRDTYLLFGISTKAPHVTSEKVDIMRSVYP